MTDFKQLRVGQLALELVVQTYEATTAFPPQERYGLVSQMRRAAVSIGANIAEGAGRNTDGEFAHFLRLARYFWGRSEQTKGVLGYDVQADRQFGYGRSA